MSLPATSRLTSSPDPTTLKLRRTRPQQFLPTFGRHLATAKDPDWEYLKDCIRIVAGAARNDKGRDLDADYLTDAVLDGSIAGAVSKFRRGGPQ
jgi:hypothetical protein